MPYPEYFYDTRLIYGNEAAPNLCFSRKPNSSVARMNEKQLEKYIKKGDKKIKKMESKALTDDDPTTNFQSMGNNKFDVLFNALDRNNEVEFRLLFTPLAQKNIVNLIDRDDVKHFEELLKVFKEAHDFYKTNLSRKIMEEVKNIFLNNSVNRMKKMCLISALTIWFNNFNTTTKENVFSGSTRNFIGLIKEGIQDDDLCLDKLAPILTGIRIEDWHDKTIDEIISQNGIVYIPHPYDLKRHRTVLAEDTFIHHKLFSSNVLFKCSFMIIEVTYKFCNNNFFCTINTKVNINNFTILIQN